MAAARFTITSWERPVFAIASTGHRYVQICAAVDAGRNSRGRHNRFIRSHPPVYFIGDSEGILHTKQTGVHGVHRNSPRISLSPPNLAPG